MPASRMINFEKLYAIAEERAKEYQTNKPYNHIVIDNALNPEVLDKVLEEFPTKEQISWITFDNKNEKKYASRDENQFGDITRQFIHALNSAPFLKFLEKLTGIPNLIPDPALLGGGLHQIFNGGMLKVHADFNIHPDTNLDRRLNLLIYLNKDWKEEYGGYFELWNQSLTKADVKILPLYNRITIFSTTSNSYHGHPDPLTCPEDRSRKSIALYYYTNGRPEHEKVVGLDKHSSLYVSRNNSNEVIADSIKFMRVKGILKKFVPPIFVDVVRRLKGK